MNSYRDPVGPIQPEYVRVSMRMPVVGLDLEIWLKGMQIRVAKFKGARNKNTQKKITKKIVTKTMNVTINKLLN